MDISTLAAAKVLCGGGGGGSANAVKYTEQTLTEEQQTQARKNQGLYWSESSGFAIEWDGDTTGRATIVIDDEYEQEVYCKVSDRVFASSDFVGSRVTMVNGQSIEIDPRYVVEIVNGLIMVADVGILNAHAGTYDLGGISLTVPEDGVYFLLIEDFYVTRLENVHETVSKIDPKFLPDNTIYITIPDTTGYLDEETYAILNDDTKNVVCVYDGYYLHRVRITSTRVEFSMTSNYYDSRNDTITLAVYGRYYDYEYSVSDTTWNMVTSFGNGLSFDGAVLNVDFSSIKNYVDQKIGTAIGGEY